MLVIVVWCWVCLLVCRCCVVYVVSWNCRLCVVVCVRNSCSSCVVGGCIFLCRLVVFRFWCRCSG